MFASTSLRCIAAYIYIYINICRNIIKHNIRTSMNERTHFLIKIYLSQFILESVDVGCVWEMTWRRGQIVILTQSSSDNSSTSSSSWLGCSTVGHRGPKALCLPLALISASCPQLTPTGSNCLVHQVIQLSHVHILPLFFRLFTQVHLLTDSSVEGQYVTVILFIQTLKWRCFDGSKY